MTIPETISLMQRAGALEIKTFTGEKTLMNAVALVLHGYLVFKYWYLSLCANG
jgi:hypothetical protein